MMTKSSYQETDRQVAAKVPYQEVDRQAAEWLARIDAGPMLPAEKAIFDDWLARDPRHLGAYAKAEAVLAQLERVGAAGTAPLRSPESSQRQISRRSVMLTGSVAAGVAAALFGANFVRRYLARETYATRIGETKVVPLVD